VNVLRLSLLGAVLALPVAASGQTFYEVESVTIMEPKAEYLRLALAVHELCNISRTLKNLPPQPPPVTPTPYVHERVWTASNGRDFVLRRRNFELAPVDAAADLDCRWEVTWREQTLIQRGGATIRVTRSSDGASEIERNAFAAPWSLDAIENYPLRTSAMRLSLRCADTSALDNIRVLRPMAGMSELCIAEAPLFRNEDGFSLVVHSTTEASMFGGRGGEFRALQRVRRFGVYNATDRTWNPQTYLSD
jgi:hypothetical protein